MTIDSSPFRAAGHYPLSVGPAEAVPLVRGLRAFIGADRLAKAAKAYAPQPGMRGEIRSLRLRAYQPLIESFACYDALTMHGRRPLKKLPPALHELVTTAAMAQAVVPTLDAETAEHQRGSLVSLEDRYKPLMLEWSSAVQAIRRHKAKLAWTPPGRNDLKDFGGEFVAQVGNLEFEIECKRQTTMIHQLLGQREEDRITSAIGDLCREKKLQGTLTVELDEPETGDVNDEIPDLQDILRQCLRAGDIDIRLSAHARLSGRLDRYDGKPVPRGAWDADVKKAKPPAARGFTTAADLGSHVANPLCIFLTAPAKKVEDLTDYLWKKKFTKAASQCSGKRGAILMFEWEGVSHPKLFVDAGLFAKLTEDTFAQFPHVARIVMRCEETLEARVGGYQATTAVYACDSKVTSFPEVLQFMKIDLPL